MFARACGCNTVCYQVLSVVFGVLSYVSGGFCGVLDSQGLIGGGVPGVWLSPPSRRRLGGSLNVCTVLSRSHTHPHALTGCNPTFSSGVSVRWVKQCLVFGCAGSCPVTFGLCGSCLPCSCIMHVARREVGGCCSLSFPLDLLVGRCLSCLNCCHSCGCMSVE